MSLVQPMQNQDGVQRTQSVGEMVTHELSKEQMDRRNIDERMRRLAQAADEQVNRNQATDASNPDGGTPQDPQGSSKRRAKGDSSAAAEPVTPESLPRHLEGGQFLDTVA
jgi:hypothetical protein